ncbi:MAG: DUF2231 domain-containing protein, partial [Actinomycetota bacterium]
VWESERWSTEEGEQMPKLFSIKPTLTLRGRKFDGIRGWAGKPTHPPLTDFPVVCYVLAAVFDVVSFIAGREEPPSAVAHDFSRAATFVIVTGAIVSVATAVTGFWDWWKGLPRDSSTGFIGKAEHTQVWRTANWHMTVMLTVTAIVLADIVLRFARFDDGSTGAVVMALSVVVAALVALGAAYGGALVFEYQFNVQPLKGSTAWNETEDDQLPGAKPPTG